MQLQLNVQVDRIPSPERTVQLGIRLSAAFIGMPGEGALPRDSLLPWKWAASGSAEAGSWNIHQAESWKLWAVVPGLGVLPVETFRVITGGAALADVDPSPQHGVGGRFEQHVENYLGKLRTVGAVVGAIETLTQLPAPMPARLKVWTAVEFAEAEGWIGRNDVTFLAVPIGMDATVGATPVAARTIVLEPMPWQNGDPAELAEAVESRELWKSKWGNADTFSVDRDEYEVRLGSDDQTESVRACVVTSLPQGILTIPDGPGSHRLIDLSTFEIRKPAGSGLLRRDWMTELPHRLAELLDPSIHCLAVVDVVLQEWLYGVTGEPAERRRAAFINDIKPVKDGEQISALLSALTDLYRPLLLEPFTGSPGAVSVGEELFGRLSALDNSLYLSALGRLLATMADQQNDPDRERQWLRLARFVAFSRQQLLSMAGIPIDEIGEEPAGDPAVVKPEILLSTPAGSLRLLLERCTRTTEIRLPADGSVLLGATVRQAGITERVAAVPPWEDTWRIGGAGPFEIWWGLPSDDRENFRKIEHVDGGSGFPAPEGSSKDEPMFLQLKGSSGTLITFPNDGWENRGRDSAIERILQADPDVDLLRTARRAAFGHKIPELIEQASKGDATSFAASLRGLAVDLATRNLDAAFNAAEQAINDAELKDLWVAIREASKIRARAALHEVIPDEGGDGAFPRIAAAVEPIQFTIDQLQDFDDKRDLWTRLAGVGLLLGRTRHSSRQDEREQIDWYSGNATTLHVSRDVGVLGEDSAVQLRRSTQVWEKSRVDPLPWPVNDVNGVRGIVVRYSGVSLVSNMQSTPESDRQNSEDALRRPEAYLFPVTKDKSFPRLPGVAFGRTYHVLPYLIGHGGTLPLWLRASQDDPTTLVGYKTGTERPWRLDVDFGRDRAGVRSIQFLRDVPVAPPTLLLPSDRPGIPEGVRPLAVTIPLEPAPVSLRPSRPTDGTGRSGSYFFLDANQERGVLQSPQKGASLQIQWQCTTGHAEGVHLVLAWTRTQDGVPGKTEVLLQACNTGRLREALWAGTKLYLDRLEAALPNLPNIDDVRDIAVGFRVEEGYTADTQVTAPQATWFAAGQRIEGPRAMPSEAGSATRHVSVLDGIDANLPFVKDKWVRHPFALNLRWPTVDIETFCAWLMGALSDDDFAPQGQDDAKGAINKAQASRRISDGAPRTLLFDPAVNDMAYEIVRIHPNPMSVKPLTVKPLTMLKVERPEEAVYDATTPLGSGRIEFRVSDHEDFRTANVLAAGQIYEVRCYAVIKDEAQRKWAPMKISERFGSGVVGHWRYFEEKEFWLSPPATVTLEVATERMPEFGHADSMRMELLRRPQHADDRLQVRLDPSAFRSMPDGDRLAYVGEVALLSQRWGWRGRPAPALAPAADDASGERSLSDFVDNAFIGRSDDDVGVQLVRDVDLTGEYVDSDVAAPDRPVLFDRSLEYRGGANLWRFALRIRSRYAAMRRDDPRFVRFSHFPQDRVAGAARWQTQMVKQRDGERRLQRPGLMLVLPLTEPLQDEHRVPPLLAIFNEPMHHGGHVGDGVEATVEMARHPYTQAERQQYEHAKKWSAERKEQLGSLIRAAVEYSDRAPGEQDDASRAAVVAGVKALARDLLAQELWTRTDAANSLLTAIAERDEDGWATGNRGGKPFFPQELLDLETVVSGLTPDAGLVPVPVSDDPGSVKYWAQEGVDPIRSAVGRSGSPVAVRLDGAIGYSFDSHVDAGRYDRAGFLASLVTQSVDPWTLVKLQFRRLEVPEFMDASPHLIAGRADAGRIVRIANFEGAGSPAVDDPDKPIAFDLVHEGVTIDWTAEVTNDPAKQEVLIAWSDKARNHVTVSARRENAGETDTVGVRLLTQSGHTGKWKLSVDPGHECVLRLVAGVRPKPNGGVSHRPIADISVRVFVGRGESASQSDDSVGDQWLTIGCLALEWEGDDLPCTEELRAHIRATGLPDKVTVRPVRVSEFTPGVWCQFAANMSLFRGYVEEKGQFHEKAMHAKDMQWRTAGDNTISLHWRNTPDLGNAEVLQIRRIGTFGAPDAEGADPSKWSEVQEILYLIVTRWIHTASGRLTEQPVAVLEIDSDSALTATVERSGGIATRRAWPADGADLPESGRLRIARVLVRRSDTRDAVKRFERLFQRESDGGGRFDMNPPDAAGMILGVSDPIDGGRRH